MRIKLEEKRKSQGLSQAQLSAKSGVPQPMISQIETEDVKNPTAATLCKLASALGCDLEDLVEYEKSNNIDF